MRSSFRQPERPERIYKMPNAAGCDFRLPQLVEDRVIAQPKRQPIKRAEPQPRIRESANGEECTVRLPGCPGDPAMTIWSHDKTSAGGKGMRIKSLDLCGCFACTYCDAVYDGQRPRPAGMTLQDVELAWYRGHMRSLVKLNQKGLL